MHSQHTENPKINNSDNFDHDGLNNKIIFNTIDQKITNTENSDSQNKTSQQSFLPDHDIDEIMYNIDLKVMNAS